MREYDPKRLELGDVFLLRRTFNLPVPPAGETVWSPIVEIDLPDIATSDYVTSTTQLHIDPTNPDNVVLTALVTVVPERIKEYRERIAEEARLRAMEQASEEDL